MWGFAIVCFEYSLIGILRCVFYTYVFISLHMSFYVKSFRPKVIDIIYRKFVYILDTHKKTELRRLIENKNIKNEIFLYPL